MSPWPWPWPCHLQSVFVVIVNFNQKYLDVLSLFSKVSSLLLIRVSTNTGKKPRTNNRENLKKLRITANNRVIIRGIRIRQYHEYFRITVLFAFFFLNTSRIVINNRNIRTSPVPNIRMFKDFWQILNLSRYKGSRSCIIY